MTIRPLVRKFHSSEYLNALATGEICFAVGFSGDVKQAQKRAAEAKGGIEIAYAIPNEGAQLWFDNLAIPRDAKNVAEAHEFINFLQTPEVAGRNSNFISYANGNLASQKFIDKDVLEDRTIYPDEAMMSRLYTVNAHDAATVRLLNRLWTRIKTGQIRRQRSASPPAAVQPQPLLRMLAHPGFDDIGDRLRRARDVDPALGVAHRFDRIGDLAPELVAVGQADDAHAMDRAIDVAGKLRQQRDALQARPKKVTSTPRDLVLVDQHADLAAALERARQPDRRIEPGRHQRAHAARAHFNDRVGDRADIGRAIEDRACRRRVAGESCGQLPVSRDACRRTAAGRASRIARMRSTATWS